MKELMVVSSVLFNVNLSLLDSFNGNENLSIFEYIDSILIIKNKDNQWWIKKWRKKWGPKWKRNWQKDIFGANSGNC